MVRYVHDMDLTPAEQDSLDLAESDHGYNVRIVYFKIKRCPDCTDKRSCRTHEDEMANIQ